MLQEASGLLECVIKSDKTTIILTEGKTDVMHLSIARRKLKVPDIFDIFSCGDNVGGGADKLKQFLVSCPAELFSDKKIIGFLIITSKD